MAVPALTLWALTAAGGIQPWMVFALVLVRGSVLAIVNAVALNSVVIHTSRIAGPAAAGAVIALLGVGPCFALNALSFGAMLVALRRMDRAALKTSAPAQRAKG